MIDILFSFRTIDITLIGGHLTKKLNSFTSIIVAKLALKKSESLFSDTLKVIYHGYLCLKV